MLTSQQAEWLVTFYRNLPGQKQFFDHDRPQVPQQLESHQSYEEEVYPYFDLRDMNR